MIAHRLRDNLPHDLPIAISNAVIDVMNCSCVDLIVNAIKRAEDRFGRAISLAIFDTWAKAMGAGGGDEQQAKDQNIALANMRRVLDKVSIHIATVGHTGKDESRGERGSNAKKCDADLEAQFSGETIKSVVVTKANDQPLGLLTSFQLEPFDFGLDEDGDAFRTHIVAKEIISGAGATKHNLSDKQQLALEALAEAILKHGVELPSQYQLPAGLKSVTEDQWRDELYRLKVLDRKAKNPRARLFELRTRLQRRRLIGVRDETVWPATTMRDEP